MTLIQFYQILSSGKRLVYKDSPEITIQLKNGVLSYTEMELSFIPTNDHEAANWKLVAATPCPACSKEKKEQCGNTWCPYTPTK